MIRIFAGFWEGGQTFSGVATGKYLISSDQYIIHAYVTDLNGSQWVTKKSDMKVRKWGDRWELEGTRDSNGWV